MSNPSVSQLAETRKIPVFIGVTGHRNIRSEGEDLRKLTEAVRRVLCEITGRRSPEEESSRYPHTEFILLTSLAAGADQFVTRVAAGMGMRYAAALPMARDAFLNRVEEDGSPDFTQAQKQEALRLMQDEKCVFVYEMPDEGGTDQKKFCDVARFISDNSCCNIALWDGLVSRTDEAGTGATVRDSLRGVTWHSECFPGITVPETRPIYHIYTPRAGDTRTSAHFFKTRSIFPEPLLETGDNWFSLNQCDEAEIGRRFSEKWQKKTGQRRQAVFEEHLRLIDRYNCDVEAHADFIDGQKSSPDNRKLSPDNETAKIFREYFQASDGLAIYAQARRNRQGIFLILAAGLAYAALNFFSDFRETVWALLAYILLLCLAGGVFVWLKRRRYHESYVAYRAIAEGLRVQFFWREADVLGHHNTSAQVQDYYLRRQKGSMEWIRMALRAVNLLAAVSGWTDGTSVSSGELKKIAGIWLGKMDVPNKQTGKWEYPLSAADGIKKIGHNGQSGYFLQKSLRSLRDVNFPADMDKETRKTARQYSHTYAKGKRLTRAAAVCLLLSLGMILFLTGVLFVRPDAAWLEKTFVVSALARNVALFAAGLLLVNTVVSLIKNKRITLYAAACFVVALVIGAVVAVMSGKADASWLGKTLSIPVDAKDTIIFIAGLLPIAAMVLRECERYMGYGEDVNRSAWYHSIFKRAIVEIDELDKDTRSEEDLSREIRFKLFEIGKEALIENADWVMLNEKRAPEIPSN